MRVRLPRTPTLLVALACASVSGCGVNDDPKTPSGDRPRDSAKATCAGAECRVRVTCKGEVKVVVGPAPVEIRTSKSALRSAVLADFAGTGHDQTIRC